jgi:hypothetical protein
MRFEALVRASLAAGLLAFLGCSDEGPAGGNDPAGIGGVQAVTGGAGGSLGGSGGVGGATGGMGGAAGAAGTMSPPSGGMGGAGGTVVASGGMGGAGGMTGGMGGMTGGTGGMGPMGPTISATLEIPQIAPGDQLTVCTTKFLGNATEIKVKNVYGHISGGSHHFIVDRAPTEVPIEGLMPCFGLSGTDATRVLIAEKPETVFAMPPGVGFTLRPNQPLTAELHYFNPTEDPIDITATIEFEIAEGEEAANMKEASMVFAGSTDIFLPMGMPGTVEFYMPLAGTPQEPVRMFALTSHTHSLGVRATIDRVSSPTDTGVQLHESLSWAEPPMTEFMPALELTGSDGLRLRCEYVNDRDVDVVFGTAVQDEMCFMWLYYY